MCSSRSVPNWPSGSTTLSESSGRLNGLDNKTKQLINIAIQTSIRNSQGVRMHAMMAYQAGATRDEIVGAVVMNLHLTGLVTVLDSLPAALEGIEMATRQQQKKKS